MRVVLANGCFDPVHPGHVAHLQEAATYGDRLIVALTVDECVTEQKGEKRPYLTWDERALILRALRCVDEVIPSRSGWESVREVRPDIFVKGEDWRHRCPQYGIDICHEVGAALQFTSAQRFGVSEFIRRIKQ